MLATATYSPRSPAGYFGEFPLFRWNDDDDDNNNNNNNNNNNS